MPMSKDPTRRARSLANLRRGTPAPKGNQYARKHGVFSPISKTEHNAKIREITAALEDDVPVRDVDGRAPRDDAVQISLLARCMVQIERAESYVATHGYIEEQTGKVKPAAEHLMRLRREAAGHLDALGLNPRSRAKLGLDLARANQMDLAKAMSDLADEEGDDVIEAIE
jgi:terminase small subunit-like protein